MAGESDVLLVDHHGPVAVVTLNRPDARNALDSALRRALWRTMGRLDADDEVGCIVLTGADPAFCAGLDLKELGGAGGGLGGRGGLEITGGARPFPETATPVVGAVNGSAVTGGFELALLCDLLVASTEARFADTHARVGIQPGWGLTVHLAQAIGVRRARELSFTGNYLDAATAERWGLVNHVVAHDELLPTAVRLATEIAENDRAAVRRIRRTYAAGIMSTGADALANEGAVAAEWLAEVSGADVESRRRDVIARGRSQLR